MKNIQLLPALAVLMTVATLALVAAKLGGLLTWSWLWVLAPVWGPAALVVLLVLVLLCLMLVAGNPVDHTDILD